MAIETVRCESVSALQRSLEGHGGEMLFRGQVRNHLDSEGRIALTFICPERLPASDDV